MIHIPDYEVIEEIGRGSSGQVFRCRQSRLDRLVAVKILQEEVRADAQLEERFRREARLLAQINHPNVVEVFDFGVAEDRLFLVYELIDGDTLRNHLRRRGRLEILEAFGLVVQILHGLEAAHRAGVVHRDLKPENLLLTLDGTVKITDFGTARVLDLHRSLTKTGMVLGTPVYMSPEQCRGDHATAVADVYSVGIMLYEMLAGRPPFVGADAASVLRKHLSTPVPSLCAVGPDIPRQVEDLVLRSLDKDPSRRFPSAQAFRQALEVAMPLVSGWAEKARLETSAPTVELDTRPGSPLDSQGTRLRPLPTLALSDRRRLRKRNRRLVAAALVSGLVTGIGATLLVQVWRSGVGDAPPPMRIVRGDGAAELRWTGPWPGGDPVVRFGDAADRLDRNVPAERIERAVVLDGLPAGKTVHYAVGGTGGRSASKGHFDVHGPWTVLDPEVQLTAKLEARIRIRSSRPCRLELRREGEEIPTRDGARPEHDALVPLDPYRETHVEFRLLPDVATASSTPSLRKVMTLPSAIEAAIAELPALGRQARWEDSLRRFVRRADRATLDEERNRIEGNGAHRRVRNLLAALVPPVSAIQKERPDLVLRLLDALLPLRRLDQFFRQFDKTELVGVERAFDPSGFQSVHATPEALAKGHGLVELATRAVAANRQLFHPYDPYGPAMEDYLDIYDTLSANKEDAEGWKRRLARVRRFDVELPPDFDPSRWAGLVVALRSQALLVRYEAHVRINEEEGGGAFRIYGRNAEAGGIGANFEITTRPTWQSSFLLPGPWFRAGRNELQLSLRCLDEDALQPTTFYAIRLFGLPKAPAFEAEEAPETDPSRRPSGRADTPPHERVK